MDEGLGRLIQDSHVEQGIHSLKVHPREEVQTHHQFGHDMILMGNPSIQEAIAIK